jgi:hypothetical protein
MIDVMSTLGAGTIFRVALPRLPKPVTAVADGPQAEAAAQPALT